MKMKLFVIFIVGTLLLFPIVAADHEEDKLSCDDFSKEKLKDCEYILDSDLDEDDKEELLEFLEEESYGYSTDEQPITFIHEQSSKIKVKEIDYSTLILAWKTFIFGFINYVAFSFLTKSSFALKWLSAGY